MKWMVFIVVAMSLVAGAAHAGDWRPTSNDDKTLFLMDISTIRSVDNGKKTAWSAMVLADQLGEFKFTKVLEEFDCKKREISTLGHYYYGPSGSFITSQISRAPAEPVVPDSSAAFVFSVVCEGSKALDSRPRFDSVDAAMSAWIPGR